MQIKKVLVPIDFSKCSTHAARKAVELVKSFGAQVDLLHVLELPHYVIPDVMVTVPGEEKKSLTEFAHGEAAKDIEKLLAELADSGVKVNTRLKSGYPREEILAAAEEGEYDLVVMGTHGRRGLSHLFLGSVAEQVVRRASCPVLTIRSPEEE